MSLETQALSSAGAALGLIEQLENLVSDLREFGLTIPALARSELEVLVERLSAVAKLLDDDENLPDLIKGLQLSGRVASKVDRLKLGGEIVRLREVGRATNAEIAQQLGIGEQTVGRFLRFYDQCKPSEKARYQRSSIFDTTNQYEDLAAMIWRQLARLENLDNENHVRYISELRQLIKAAEQWMEKINQANKIEELRMAVAEILASELPHRRAEILQRFATIGLQGLPSVVSVRGS